MGRGFKSKKGFTLIELLAVMAIMVIASALILPNIQGMIDKTEESKLKNYCKEASTNLKNYTNLLLIGETKVPYQKKNGELDYYTIADDIFGLEDALNEYNMNSEFDYFVMPYVVGDDKSSATTNPCPTIRADMNANLVKKNDKMVTVIEKTTSSTNTRTEIYKLIGFWYYSYSKDAVVYYYYAPTMRCGTGFSKLTKDGK